MLNDNILVDQRLSEFYGTERKSDNLQGSQAGNMYHGLSASLWF